MKTLRDAALLYQRYFVQMLRNPVWLAVGFSTPLLYLALFTPLLKHVGGSAGLPGSNVLDGFLPAILALLAFASGSGLGFSTIFELRAGVTERFRVTPTSRFAILLGPILASMTLMFVFDAMLVAAGAAFGFHVPWLGLAVLASGCGSGSSGSATSSTAAHSVSARTREAVAARLAGDQ